MNTFVMTHAFTPNSSNKGQRWIALLSLLVCLGLSTGCLGPQTSSRTPRTAVEQLLLSQAAAMSLAGTEQEEPSLPPGASVKIDTAGLTEDRKFLKEIVEGWTAKKGYLIAEGNDKPGYRIRLIVNAFGTEQGEAFFGIPAIQSTIIPFALPEITVFRAQRQKGFIQFSMNVFEEATGKLIRSTKAVSGRTYHNRYTFLFFFSYLSTNLEEVP